MPEDRKVEIIERTSPQSGYYRIDRFRLRHSLHRGGMSPEISREVFQRGHVGAVLPVDMVRGEVLLIEQFRPGALAAGWEPWVLECVAGVIEQGETPEDLVRREAVEEAGCELGELRFAYSYLTSPGASSETVHLFLGRADLSAAGGIHGLAEEGEDIRVLVVGIDEALAMLAEGRIVNAKTIIALQWLAANRAELQRKWGAGA
ncbi:MAG: NUDIX domain-containing protein [Rhodospirillales bacterium]